MLWIKNNEFINDTESIYKEEEQFKNLPNNFKISKIEFASLKFIVHKKFV